VEAARDLVPAAAELGAGVEDGVDDLEGVLAAGVTTDRDAAAVVVTRREPSSRTRTSTLVAWPAMASSIELSTTSQTR
jgi:hypothetical protein